MSKIIDALKKLAEISDDGRDTLIKDGACEPTRIADIIDEIRNADPDVSFTGIDEAEIDFAVDGDGIWRMRPDGYRESVATYRVVPVTKLTYHEAAEYVWENAPKIREWYEQEYKFDLDDYNRPEYRTFGMGAPGDIIAEIVADGVKDRVIFEDVDGDYYAIP